jgi:hypothetical protein
MDTPPTLIQLELNHVLNSDQTLTLSLNLDIALDLVIGLTLTQSPALILTINLK